MTAVKNVRTHGEEVEVTVHALLHAHNGIDWRIMFRDARYEALEQHRTDGAEAKVHVLSLLHVPSLKNMTASKYGYQVRGLCISW